MSTEPSEEAIKELGLLSYTEIHERMTAGERRLAELEAAMRKWRDHYECSPSPDGVYIMVPAHQIDELLDQK